MPAIICRNCGRTTNTALSEWVKSKDDKADGCYAAWEEGKWVKGCWYGKPMYAWMRFVVDTYIFLEPIKEEEEEE